MGLILIGEDASHRPADCQKSHDQNPLFTCKNSTISLLKLSSFDMDPITITSPANVSLRLVSKITESIVPGSILELSSFKRTTEIFSGKLDLREIWLYQELHVH